MSDHHDNPSPAVQYRVEFLSRVEGGDGVMTMGGLWKDMLVGYSDERSAYDYARHISGPEAEGVRVVKVTTTKEVMPAVAPSP